MTKYTHKSTTQNNIKTTQSLQQINHIDLQQGKGAETQDFWHLKNHRWFENLQDQTWRSKKREKNFKEPSHAGLPTSKVITKKQAKTYICEKIKRQVNMIRQWNI